MYRTVDSGMGFSLKPPKWLRNLAHQASSAVQEVEGAVDTLSTRNQAPPQSLIPADLPSWVLPVGLAAVAWLMFGRKRG